MQNFSSRIFGKRLENEQLTSGRLLARNTIWNLVGQTTPILVAIFAIPILIKGLGTDRFGVLTLIWMVIGYFSIFDLGLGRALTQQLAEKLGTGSHDEIPALAWTSLLLMLVFGLMGVLIMGLLSPWLIHDVLKIPESLQPEALHTFYLLTASIPIVISTAGLRGILEAQQLFGLVNTVRVLMGVFTFVGPLLVLPFSQNLFPVVTVLVVGRLFTWLIYFQLCLHVTPVLRQGITPKRAAVKPLVRFGSWMTASNIIGPLIGNLDRILIGGMISAAAVAYYSTPLEVVSKTGIISAAIAGVLFPAFSASFVQDKNRTVLLLYRGVKFIFLLMFPITLVVVTFAHEGLDLWLGPEFAQHSTTVMKWLAIGVFMNSFVQIPFALIQGFGRPDLTAKLHLIELPIYLPFIWWMIRASGIEGAAIAGVVRAAVDLLVLFYMVAHLLQNSASILKRMLLTMGFSLLILPLAALPTNIFMRGIFLLLTLLSFTLASWFRILDSTERTFLLNRLKTALAF